MIYKECKECGHTMHGVSSKMPDDDRDTCQPCGGNQTSYSAYNPHPKCTLIEENEK